MCIFFHRSHSGLKRYLPSDAQPQYCASFLDPILNFFVQNTLIYVSSMWLMTEPDLCVDVTSLRVLLISHVLLIRASHMEFLWGNAKISIDLLSNLLSKMCHRF